MNCFASHVMRTVLGASILSILLSLSAPSWGQEASSPSDQPSPTLKKREPVPASSDQYILGSGDEVNVQVANRPEVSGTFIIGPDDQIHIPFADAISIGGMPIDAARKAISDALLKLYTSAVVDVQISKYGSNRVLLLGDIEHPGVIYFNEPPNLLDAISRGGAMTGSDKSNHGMPVMCTIYHKGNSLETVDMRNIAVARNIVLQRDDIVYVPGDRTRLVSVIGEVKNPGPVTMEPNSSDLMRLLADAGGITPEAGSPVIQIINPTTHITQKVSFKDLTSARGTDVKIEAGDVIFVPRSDLAKLGFFLQQIAPGVQAGTIAAIAAH